MVLNINSKAFVSELFDYFASFREENEGIDQLPSMRELSKKFGVSVTKLREQLEVAKAMGVVEVNPRTGMRLLPYNFLPAVRHSLMYALSLDCWNYFADYSELRNHLEETFWHQAVRKLDSQDHEELRRLVDQAWEKLRSHPVQIPHYEHRDLHLKIYSRLENPFVFGIFEAYWHAYENVGLNLFADYNYLEQVWEYHRQIVEGIITGNYDSGYEALVAHKDLLYHHPRLIEKPVEEP